MIAYADMNPGTATQTALTEPENELIGTPGERDLYTLMNITMETGEDFKDALALLERSETHWDNQTLKQLAMKSFESKCDSWDKPFILDLKDERRKNSINAGYHGEIVDRIQQILERRVPRS